MINLSITSRLKSFLLTSWFGLALLLFWAPAAVPFFNVHAPKILNSETLIPVLIFIIYLLPFIAAWIFVQVFYFENKQISGRKYLTIISFFLSFLIILPAILFLVGFIDPANSWELPSYVDTTKKLITTQTTSFDSSVGKEARPEPRQSCSLGNLDLKKLPDSQITFLGSDLGLISSGSAQRANYYSVGSFTTDPFTGFKRIVAVFQGYGPSGPGAYLFATRDGKEFTVDSSINSYSDQTLLEEKILENFGTCVSKVDNLLALSHPKIIRLDSTFALYRGSVLTDSIVSEKLDEQGNQIYEPILVKDFSDWQVLDTADNGLSLLAKMRTAKKNVEGLSVAEREAEALRQKYLLGTTEVLSVDKGGLGVSYNLTFLNRAESYEKQLKDYYADVGNNKYPLTPNLRFAKTEIVTESTLYDNYDTALPTPCSLDYNTPVVKNIGEADLKEIGTLNGRTVYTPADAEHPLVSLELNSKVFYQDNKKPDLKTYSSKNPLLFFKDFWGRYVMLGEGFYPSSGGCGKPVVYLYPEKPMEVAVKIDVPVAFVHSAPQYADGWRVVASPDGELKDLQPYLTDCPAYRINDKALNYAQDACLKGTYPYLYWSGGVRSVAYPDLRRGWIVSRDGLNAFLSSKLDEVGFNQKEKSDFMEYWLPELLSRSGAYYRISFLQTREMNLMIPLEVTPRPESVFRLFLDYSVLQDQGSAGIEPQVLEKVERRGFTLVEWGGLNKSK